MDYSKEVTIAANFWTSIVGRHPRLKSGSGSVVANDAEYDFERALEHSDDETNTAIVRGDYRSGLRTPSTSRQQYDLH